MFRLFAASAQDFVTETLEKDCVSAKILRLRQKFFTKGIEPMQKRRLPAAVVALALGASTLVVPTTADAQMTTRANKCIADYRASAEFPDRQEGSDKTSDNGVFQYGTRPQLNANGQLEVYFWLTINGAADRVIEEGIKVELGLDNVAKDPSYSETFTLSALPIATSFEGVNGKQVNVTHVAEVADNKVKVDSNNTNVVTEVPLGDLRSLKADDTITYAWVARSASAYYESGDGKTTIDGVNRLVASVYPYPAENDNCVPLDAKQSEVPTVIANGTEYKTNIKAENGAASDYARLTGVIKQDGKAIENAKVRIDADGNVYVTLPVGSTGEKDNNKPGELDVELYAKPREGGQAGLEIYNTNARIGGTFKLKTQQWAPSYGDGKTSPGNTVTIALDKGTPQFPDGTTLSIIDSAPNNANLPWDAELEEGTQALKVTAPLNARKDDYVDVTVRATYPDGSQDELKSRTTVTTTLAEQYQPGYDVVITRPGIKVDLPQIREQELPKGTTFEAAPDQDFGDWDITIDKNTGLISATPPKTARDGEVKTINVLVKYPGDSEDTVPGTVIVAADPQAQNPDAYYLAEITRPGVKVTVDKPRFTADAPEGTTYKIHNDASLPSNWDVTVNPDGTVDVTPPTNAKAGDRIIVPVQISYPDGSSITRPAIVVVVDENQEGTPDTQYPPSSTKPGTVVIVNPKGGEEGSTYIVDRGTVPPGWTINIDKNTGEARVTPPADAQPGDFGVINVDITTPGGKTITRPVVVTVVGDPNKQDTPDTPGVQNPDQSYEPKQTKPDVAVTVNPAPSAPGGTTYVITPNWKAPQGWQITVDEKSGQVGAIPPADAKPGDYVSVPVEITYPNGDKVTRHAVVVVVDEAKTPKEQPPVDYNPGTTNGGTTIIIRPSAKPDGGKFEITPGWKAPDGWNITVNPSTGDITATPPKDAKPGSVVVVPVEVTYEDGTKVTRPGTITVGGEAPKTSEGATIGDGGKVTVTPGAINNDIRINVPGGNTDGLKLPDGWTWKREGDTIIVTPPKDLKPTQPDFDIKIPGRDGDVNVRVEVGPAKVTDQSSTENLERCFADMSSHGGPLLWLIPIGLAAAVGAPLIAAAGPEISASAQRVADQLNIENPFGRFGNNVERPAFLRQLDIEAARLNAQFGPQATEILGALAAATLAIGAIAGLAALCAPGENETANRIEESSKNGSSLGDFLGRKGDEAKAGSSEAAPSSPAPSSAPSKPAEK